MSGSTREQPRAPAKQQIDFFLDLFAKNDLTDTMIFTHFGLKISRKCDPKNTQKTGPSENRVFGAKVSLSEAPGVDFRRFYLRKHLPGASIFGVFSRTAIMSKSCSRCSGNTIFKCRTLQKSTRRATPKGTGTKNRRKSHPAPSLGALFRPRTRFWSILGSRLGGKIHEKCA